MTGEPDRSRGPATPAQLLVYGLAPGAAFEGQLVGAIERRGRGEGSLVAPLLGFRLDPGERRRVSEKALRAGAHSGALRQLGEALEPGAAVAAVLVEHVWVRAMDDAVSRTGGKPLASELVDAASLGELTADLIATAARGEKRG